MKYLTWILAFGLLSYFFNNWLDKQHNPNNALSIEGNSAPILLRQNRKGHYVAPGFINSHPVTFLLDTGATELSIPEPLAREIGLPQGRPMQVHTANGTAQVYRTQLHKVQLGHIAIQDIGGHINPHMDGDTVLLGMSFLKHLELRQFENQLELALPR